MRDIYRRYVENLTAAFALVKPRLDKGMTEEEILQTIHRCADGLFQIHQENDAILKEILFSRTAEDLTPGEAEDLGELADALFDYDRSLDVGIAYYIHKLLYAYAQVREDLDLTIKELYCQGITLMYLNVKDSNQGINLFVDEIGVYFRAGAAYLDQYEKIRNPKTRGYIIRCLGNMKYGLQEIPNDGEDSRGMLNSWEDYMECFRRTMDIVENPRYRAMDPDMPWDSFAYTMHYDRTRFLTGLRRTPSPEIAAEVLESAEYVYVHQEQIAKVKGRAIGKRTQYAYAAARYHAGRISARELLDIFFSIYEAADLRDFSNDNIWVQLYLPDYIRVYAKHVPPEQRGEIDARVRRALDRQQEFLFLLPRNEYAIQVARSLRTITGGVGNRQEELYHRVLGYVLACHTPTVVHSRVVARMARRLCARMAQVAPEQLEGAFGLEDAAGRDRQRLLELTYRSGLYHDLGKCMLLSQVGLYSRKLLDEEFACIKLHPFFGYSLLESMGLHDMASAAYYHHRAYNHSGGYPVRPAECPASMQTVVDIITVVDSLDAGTDNIGRSYAAAKSFTRLVEELRLGRGTRYAPAVVDLFEDPAFCQETEQFLLESRRRAYVEAYGAKS